MFLQYYDSWWRGDISNVAAYTNPRELFRNTWISLPADSTQLISRLDFLDGND